MDPREEITVAALLQLSKMPLSCRTGEMEINASLASKRKRETRVQRTRKKTKFAKLQDECITFSAENARLREELHRYREMSVSLQTENILLKNESFKMKNGRLTNVDNDILLNKKEEKEFKGKEEIKEEEFTLPDLNVPLIDPFYVQECSTATIKPNLVNITAITLAATTTPSQECVFALTSKNVAAKARKHRMECMRLKSTSTLANKRRRLQLKRKRAKVKEVIDSQRF